MLTLDVSLLGVQRACIATDATIGCWMVCFENARLEAKKLALFMTPKSVNFFKYAAQLPRFLAVVCAAPCQFSVFEFGAVMKKMVSDSMYQVRIKSFPRWSLLLFVLSMALWSLSIALRVARTVNVLCQALAVRVIADCLSSR